MADWHRTPSLRNQNGELLEFRNSAVTLMAHDRIPKLKIQCRTPGRLDLVALEKSTGVALPSSPTELTGTTHSVFWTSPGEWLIVSRSQNPRVFSQRLEDALRGTMHALTDVSDSLATIELTGPKARELLSEDCGVDLDATRFLPGHYALTRLRELAVIIHRTGAGPDYRVYVDRHLAHHLWESLKDGASLMA